MPRISLIDQPNAFAPLETLERHLERVKALPKDTWKRDALIKRAQEVLDQARKLHSRKGEAV